MIVLKTATVAMATALAAMTLASSAGAATQVFNVSPLTVGNQPQGDLPLDLGMDFTVNKAVTIYSLGAFTNGTNAIPVTLFNSAGTPLASASISAAPLAGSDYAFASITPLSLAAGTYQIEATYQPGTNIDYNPYEPGATSTVTFNTLGGSLSFLGDYYNLHGTGAMATTLDTLSTRGYGAGSFLATAVPEPAAWAMMLMGFLGLGGVLRNRRIQPVLAA